MPHLTRRFGGRPFGILVCTYIWILLGIGAFRDLPVAHPGVFHLQISGQIRGSIWIGTAVIAAVFAWSRWWSNIALAVLMFMPMLQVASYTAGWVLHLIPGGSPGYPDGWYVAAFSTALVAIVLLAALTPSPPVKQVHDVLADPK